jgi:hypothetical protein
MDLVQRKLTRDEWNSVELPVSNSEKQILELIKQGFHDINKIENTNISLSSFLKLNTNDVMDKYLFHHYFELPIKTQLDKYKKACKNIEYKIPEKQQKQQGLKKVDSLRIQQNDATQIEKHKNSIFEFVLLNMSYKMLRYYTKEQGRWTYYYYSLYHVVGMTISNVNEHVRTYVRALLTHFEPNIDMKNMLLRSADYIEKNEYLNQFSDMSLYTHQKEIFSIFKQSSSIPRLVLYIAPTATGKTLTPIGLSEHYKIIFVCAARHVGISLSKSAISAGKKVAFGFGCECAEDIRLHYFAAKEYTKDWRSGGIRKVDNTVGDKVEIIICDIKSYLYAMYYMLAFNKKEEIITYWDEPTITLDYDEHPCHEVIQNIWKENTIPNMVLSSATLPKMHEIQETIADFRGKFDGAQIHSIHSYDCKKTIPIINKYGYAELPHYVFDKYDDILRCVEHCEDYKTLLRYFDLTEVSSFVIWVNEQKVLTEEYYEYNNYFDNVHDVTMQNIKHYYLVVLKNIIPDQWDRVYHHFQNIRKYRIQPNAKEVGNALEKIPSVSSVQNSTVIGGGELRKTKSVFAAPIVRHMQPLATPTNHGIQIATRDAYTLTDGPTIFLADDVEKIGKFYLQEANIPVKVLKEIMLSIQFNNNINDKILKLEKSVEDGMAKEEGKEKKISEGRVDATLKQQMKELDTLRSLIKSVTLNDIYVPNKLRHIEKWTHSDELTAPPFTSNIVESDVERIMAIHDIEDIWKILLLMGIGLFSQTKSIEYTEILKEMAHQQKLYMIIANGDYIYGTNYQFCHGFISKDLSSMSQEKAIQAMGRVGRNKIQQQYSVRFRDDAIIRKLYSKEENKPEAFNMNRLFQTPI